MNSAVSIFLGSRASSDLVIRFLLLSTLVIRFEVRMVLWLVFSLAAYVAVIVVVKKVKPRVWRCS